MMRDQGRLVEWHEDEDYGFIQPNDRDKDLVFIQLKDFARPGPRPIVGCALDYTVILDEQSRFRAQQVVYLKAAQTKTLKPSHTKPQSSQRVDAIQILGISYILILAALVLMGWLSGMMVLLVSLINVLTYWCYAQDNEAQQMGKQGIPEYVLHILAFLGGWPAAWLAQQKLRHKTQKQPFRQIYFCTIGFHLLLLMWLISPLNRMFF